MDTNDARDNELADRANRSYWDSDASVNEIAAELDLSKGSLYGMIRPRGAAIDCPECGSELEYPNRTARDKRFVTCPACGLEEEEAVIRELANDVPASSFAPSGSTGSQRTLLATALLGAAAGILLIRWMRR